MVVRKPLTAVQRLTPILLLVMLWWRGRPSHRTTLIDSDTAIGNVVVVRTAYTTQKTN